MSNVSDVEKELESIKDGLTKLKGKAKSADELQPFQDRLLKIDQSRKDGKFVDAKGEIPPGQAKLHDLLSEAYELKDQIMDSLP